jgi:hypothetical protein
MRTDRKEEIRGGGVLFYARTIRFRFYPLLHRPGFIPSVSRRLGFSQVGYGDPSSHLIHPSTNILVCARRNWRLFLRYDAMRCDSVWMGTGDRVSFPAVLAVVQVCTYLSISVCYVTFFACCIVCSMRVFFLLGWLSSPHLRILQPSTIKTREARMAMPGEHGG